MPLHITHRPCTFEQVSGNAATVKALQALLKRTDDIPHSFLFHGPSGCGKTTFARLVASKMDMHPSEVVEINAADFRGIDMVRSMRDDAMYRPMLGKNKGWILDEAHKLSNDAQNALLKLTEDAPKRVFFFFATTDPQKLLPTLRNRCHQFQVELLEASMIERLVMDVLAVEKVTIPQEAIEKIALNAGGSPRSALVLLDKVIDLDDNAMMQVLEQSVAESTEVIALCRALLKREKWAKIAQIINGLTASDPEQIRYAVIGYCSAILLKGKLDPQAVVLLDIFANTNFMYSGKGGLIVACLRALEDD